LSLVESEVVEVEGETGVSHMRLNYKAEFDRNVRFSFSLLR